MRRKTLLLSVLVVALLLMISATAALADPPSPNATYMGIQVCQGCHPDKATGLNQTLHPWKVRPVAEATVVADFSTGADVRTATLGGETRPLVLEDADYVIGASGRGWKQRFIKVIDGVWRVLPIQWNIATKEWVPYHPDDWQTKDYKELCAGCHTTGYNVDTKEFKDFGVTCEECHGPGSEHVAAGGGKGNAIVNPANLSFEAGNAICGSCHIRGMDKATGKHEWPVGFLPGGDKTIDDLYTYTTADSKLWPDGSAKGHHQQYMDWKMSKHAANGVSCWSCHSIHNPGEGDHQLRKAGDGVCLDCHADKKDLAAHQPYMKAGFDAQPDLDWCIKCHVPKTAKSAVKYDIHNHTFSAPDPQKTIDFGGQDKMPNACNICHADETPEWALEAITTGAPPVKAAAPAAEPTAAAPAELPTTGSGSIPLLPYALALIGLALLGGGSVVVLRRRS